MTATSIDLAAFQRAVERRTNERTPALPQGPLVRVPISQAAVEFFEGHAIPARLRQFYEQANYEHPMTLGNLVFDEVNALPENNLDEVNQRCIREGLVVIGSALNGDPIVADCRNDLTVGFVNHDELWDAEGPPARELLVDTGLDIGTFFLAAVLHEDQFPVDSYDAREVPREAWKAFS